jgi:membrane protein
VNYAWGVQKYPNYFKHKLVSFIMLAAAGLLMLAALLLLSAHGIARSTWAATALERFPSLIVLGGLASRWASTLIFILVVGLVFYFVPNARVRFRDVWLGAIFTGLLWKGALLGFSWYVRDMKRFSVHGSIATVVVFLWWVFVCAVIFIYGVEFTAEYARLRAKRYGERYAERLE